MREMVMIPKTLTDEDNLLGEFYIIILQKCPDCKGLKDEETGKECYACSGLGKTPVKIPIAWEHIKNIYSRFVETLAC